MKTQLLVHPNCFLSNIAGRLGQCLGAPGKLFLTHLLAIGLLFHLTSKELSAAAVGKVVSVEAFANNAITPGCDSSRKTIEFAAYITVDGPCEVKYRWLRSDNALDAFKILTFKEAGTQRVTDTWSLWRPRYEGWESVEVTAPNETKSNRAKFVIDCCKDKEDICKTRPYTASACALDLLQTLKRLVKGEGTRICYAPLGSINVSSAMNAACYNNGSAAPGIVSYTAFYIPADTIFRVIWGSALNDSLAYHYYGACVPKPLIFPDNAGENHVFNAFLIPVSEYQTSPVQLSLHYTLPEYTALKKKAIKPADIDDLTGWYFEPTSGYIATTQPLAYHNTLSSRGLVVKVKVTGGLEIPCYLFNNYDLAGTLNWKDATVCEGDGGVITTAKAAYLSSTNEEFLDQNIPNPFGTETEVQATIAPQAKQAALVVYNLEGVKLKTISIANRGRVVVKVSGEQLVPGMYVYSLVVDGAIKASKNMVIAK